MGKRYFMRKGKKVYSFILALALIVSIPTKAFAAMYSQIYQNGRYTARYDVTKSSSTSSLLYETQGVPLKVQNKVTTVMYDEYGKAHYGIPYNKIISGVNYVTNNHTAANNATIYSAYYQYFINGFTVWEKTMKP